ncbi:MAG TPA: O-antigen ligase family protein [bacterium]|nr:O-antigen ligase family protein [bacterium]HPQ17959.1 O-antigen ligase family protein [bacterium]
MPESIKVLVFSLIILCLVLILLTGENLKNPVHYKYYIISIFFLASVVTFFNPAVGLYLLIVTMLFSPEIQIGRVERRNVVLRYDDVMIILCLLSWTITRVLKGGRLFKPSPIDKPVIFFLLICAISTARGVLIKQVSSPTKAFFYVLKLVEYFLIYYLVVNIVKSKRAVLYYIYTFYICCAVVCYIGLQQIRSGAFRVSAPFEDVSEPNTFGAYLLFMFGMLFSFFLWKPKNFSRIIIIGLLILVIYNFLYTLSRGSYMAFYPVLITIVLLTPRTKKVLAVIILIAAIISIKYLPPTVRDRIERTFRGPIKYNVPTLGPSSTTIGLDQSSSARVEKYKDIMAYWQEYPIFGLGITGAGFVDSQVMRTIGEMGIMGVLAFIWLFKTIFTEIFLIKKYQRNTLILAILTGYIGGLVGLIIHSMTANTFLIIRIMGPFWFFTGLVMNLNELYFDEIARPVSENEKIRLLENNFDNKTFVYNSFQKENI